MRFPSKNREFRFNVTVMHEKGYMGKFALCKNAINNYHALHYNIFFFIFCAGDCWTSSSFFSIIKGKVIQINNKKYMIALTQITNADIFAPIAVQIFKLLSCKALFINRKDNRNC